MAMKKVLIVLLFLTGFHAVSGQDKIVTRKSRFVNFTELGVLLGNAYQITNSSGYSSPVLSKTSFSVQTFNGLRLIPNLAAGITVGIDWLGKYQILPISAGLRKTFGLEKSNRVKAFLGLDAGYGFTWLNDEIPWQTIKGSINISPAAGLMIPTGGDAFITVSAGYKHNELTITQGTDNIYGQTSVNNNRYDRMSIRIGVSF